MIRIYCDHCGKEPTDQDFACDILVAEIVTSLAGKDMVPMQQRQKNNYHICKGCYYVHFSKLLQKKNEKK